MINDIVEKPRRSLSQIKYKSSGDSLTLKDLIDLGQLEFLDKKREILRMNKEILA